MGHSVIVCENCGDYIMEGYTGEWDCDNCGWTYNVNKGITNEGDPKKRQGGRAVEGGGLENR